MAKRKTSSVWNFFQKEEEFATCLVKPCEIKLKHSGNTTNLLKHLKCKHFQQYEECLKEIEDEKRSKRSKTECPKQLTLKKTLDKATFYRKESTKRKNIDNALIEMIVTDLQPTSVVEDNGFQKFVSVLDPRYELPSRRTVVRSLLLEKYTSVKQTLKIELDNSMTIALTTDLWTSRQTQSYCCITAHYISGNGKLKSALLETFEFNESHTAENIATHLKTVASNWEIDSKVVCVVTNNASNMVSAISKTGWRHLPCFAHTLNLIVQNAIKADPIVQQIQLQCKDVVSHFHRSVKSSDKLKEIQSQLSLPQQKLIQDVSTRWNSTYLMLQRYHNQFEAIVTALCLVGQNDLCLMPANKITIESTLKSLKPFLSATEAISGENYTSVSLIIPLVKQLQQQYLPSHHTTASLNHILSQELRQRFLTIESGYVMAVATLLDPRFKKLPFSDKSELDVVTRHMTHELASLKTSEGSQSESDSLPATESLPVPKTNELWASFDQKVTDYNSRRSTMSDSIVKVRQYFDEGNIDREKNLLEWWQQNSSRFPNLQKLARKYLCTPGSSVPSERVFSTAGQLISERRSRITPQNIDMMLFLNKNSELFHP